MCAVCSYVTLMQDLHICSIRVQIYATYVLHISIFVRDFHSDLAEYCRVYNILMLIKCRCYIHMPTSTQLNNHKPPTKPHSTYLSNVQFYDNMYFLFPFTKTNRPSQVSHTTDRVLANSWVCYHRAPRGGLTVRASDFPFSPETEAEFGG